MQTHLKRVHARKNISVQHLGERIRSSKNNNAILAMEGLPRFAFRGIAFVTHFIYFKHMSFAKTYTTSFTFNWYNSKVNRNMFTFAHCNCKEFATQTTFVNLSPYLQ